MGSKDVESESQLSASKSLSASTPDFSKVTSFYPTTFSAREHNTIINSATRKDEEKAASLRPEFPTISKQASTSNTAPSTNPDPNSLPQPTSSSPSPFPPPTPQYQLSHSSESGGVPINNSIKTLYDEIDDMYEQAEIYGWAFDRMLPVRLRVNYWCELEDEEFERMDRWSWGGACVALEGGSGGGGGGIEGEGEGKPEGEGGKRMRWRSVSPKGGLKVYDGERGRMCWCW